MRNFKAMLIASSTILFLVGCNEIQQSNIKIEPAQENELPTELSSQIKRDFKRNPKSGRSYFTRSFERLTNNDKIERAQVQNTLNQLSGRTRVEILSKLLLIDKNGDGDITAKEMLSIADSQIIQWQKSSTTYIPYEDADTNSDDVISLQESFIFAQKQALISSPEHRSHDIHLMVFDSNKDDVLTRNELDLGLAKLDEDLSNDSKQVITNSLSSPTKTKLKPAPSICKPAPPGEKDEVVFVSGYEGSGLSSVAVVGMDKETEVARLIIEEGTTPLYIVASSHTPMIWSIEGDTKRVAKFVSSRNRYEKGAGAGVVGLSKDKVEFLGRNCLGYFKAENQTKAILAKSKWGQLVGRGPDHMAAAYAINAMKLPSGENKSKKKQNLTIISGDTEIQIGKNGVIVPSAPPLDKKKSFNLYRYTIEGLITIDPKTVVAPEPVQTYDVFPREAGIVQLVESGQLMPLERGSFKIVKPIARFPSELTGGHSVKFILGEGVPMPKGSYGHSSVYSEATGECLSRRCR